MPMLYVLWFRVHRPLHSFGPHFQHYSSLKHCSLQHLLPHLHCHCPSGSGLTKDIYLEKEDRGINRWLNWNDWQWWLHPHQLHQPEPAHQHQCTDSQRDYYWWLSLQMQGSTQWTVTHDQNWQVSHQCDWWEMFAYLLGLLNKTKTIKNVRHRDSRSAKKKVGTIT